MEAQGGELGVRPALLSPRQIEVLRLISYAYSNKEIAARLNIAEPTVKGHVATLLQRFGLHNRMELMRWADQHPEALEGREVDPTYHLPGCQCGADGCPAEPSAPPLVI